MEPESQRPTSPQKLTIRVRIGAYFSHPLNYAVAAGLGWRDLIVCICFSIIGGMFGAIHCLAWNSTFPTRVEHLLWRVSALLITAFPVLLSSTIPFANNASGMMEGLLGSVGLFLIGAYCLSRACLLALALAALRELPGKAYEMPSWTVYIPHIG